MLPHTLYMHPCMHEIFSFFRLDFIEKHVFFFCEHSNLATSTCTVALHASMRALNPYKRCPVGTHSAVLQKWPPAVRVPAAVLLAHNANICLENTHRIGACTCVLPCCTVVVFCVNSPNLENLRHPRMSRSRQLWRHFVCTRVDGQSTASIQYSRLGSEV